MATLSPPSPGTPLTPPSATMNMDVPASTRPRAFSGSSALSLSPRLGLSPPSRRMSHSMSAELHAAAVQLAQEHMETHGQMPVQEYENLLKMEHMLPAHHHVHHILPISLGGVDHIDNYTHSTREHHKMLRSLPGYDGIAYNAFEVGITKITKAVERALATGKYKGPSAEELFDRGRELGRQERKAQQRRESISLASPLASPSN